MVGVLKKRFMKLVFLFASNTAKVIVKIGLYFQKYLKLLKFEQSFFYFYINHLSFKLLQWHLMKTHE